MKFSQHLGDVTCPAGAVPRRATRAGKPPLLPLLQDEKIFRRSRRNAKMWLARVHPQADILGSLSPIGMGQRRVCRELNGPGIVVPGDEEHIQREMMMRIHVDLLNLFVFHD